MEFFDKNEILVGVLYPKIEYFIDNKLNNLSKFYHEYAKFLRFYSGL